MMRKSGFTLLETMIALGVVVLGIAAGARINRVIFVATQESEDSVQATAFAEAALHLVQETAQYAQHTSTGPQALSTYFRLTGTTPVQIIPFATAIVSDQQTIQWCQPVGNAGGVGSGCLTFATTIRDSVGTKVIGDFFTAGAETVAAHRNVSATDPRLMVDATSTGTKLNPANVTTAADWDFYSRTITITKLASFDGQASGAYSVVVTVTNQVTKLSVTRSILLTDINPVS
jgi:prepilin-type N-terminal cleavage/methylation domain-containing protein